MALSLLTRTYATAYAGYAVVIRDAATKQPARIYSQAKGGLISNSGRVTVPASGVVSVYVRDDSEYTVTLINPATGQALDVEARVDAGTYQGLTQAMVTGLRHTLYQNAVSATRTSVNAAGDATTAILRTITVPGNVMRDNSSLAVTVFFTCTNSASTKAIVVNVGGSSLGAPTATTVASGRYYFEITNANSKTAQKAFNNANLTGAGANPLLSFSINTTQDFNVDVGARWGAAATAGETITIEAVRVELIP